MKATSKLRPLHSSAERPLQEVRGSVLSEHCPHADIISSNVMHFCAVLESAQKCALMRASVKDLL